VTIMHETARGYPWCIDDHGHVMLAPTEDSMDMVWLELADIEAMLLAITGQRQMAISEAAKEAAVDIWLAEWERVRSVSAYRCEICGAEVPEYKVQICCSGVDCACMGLPIEPCVCSDECYTAIMDGIGKPVEQRRLDAGIPWRGEVSELKDGDETVG